MSPESVPVFTDVRDVIANVQLSGIVFQNIRGQLRDEPKSELKGIHRDLGLLARDTSSELLARLDLTVATAEAKFKLSAIATYVKDTPFSADETAVRDFMEKVALFAVWPYLRAQLQTLSVGLSLEPITLPVLLQGQVRLTDQPTDTVDSGAEG